MKIFLRAKIHGLRATGKNREYSGSVTVDRAILAAAQMEPFEKVQVVNLETGDRWETYVVAGENESGAFELNGGSARLGDVGDRFLLMTYVIGDRARPRLVFVGPENKIEQVLDHTSLLSDNQVREP